MRDLALARVSAELALSREMPLSEALTEVASVHRAPPRNLRTAINAALRGDLRGALDALGYGDELSSLIVLAPAQARAFSLRSAGVPGLSQLLMPLVSLVPLLLASLLFPLIAAAVLKHVFLELELEFPLPPDGSPSHLLFAVEVSEWLQALMLPVLGLVLALGTLSYWLAIAWPRFRTRLFRGVARALDDARRLSWSAALSASGLDPTPALRLLTTRGSAEVARSRATTAADFDRLADDARVEATRRLARSAAALRIGLGLLAVVGGASVALHVMAKIALLNVMEGL